MAKRQRTSSSVLGRWTSLEYVSGFHNHVATEAVPDVLPRGQNSPQHVAHGLYAEQLSGTAFTCPRATNRRAWLYRLSPSVRQGNYHRAAAPDSSSLSASFPIVDPSPRRWSPLPLAPAGARVDFVDGLQTMCEGGGMANVTIVERL